MRGKGPLGITLIRTFSAPPDGCFSPSDPLLLCSPAPGRYRAVASWSRIQGIGIPMWKAVEVVLIWVVAIVLAIPEAIAFDMVELSYWERHLWVCMLASEQKSSFMMVCALSQPSCTVGERETHATRA